MDIGLANTTSPVTSIDLIDANNPGSETAAIFALSGFAGGGSTFTSRSIQWGLTLTNIDNPVVPLVSTNSDGSLSITAGGGDDYGASDTFTYAYQQLTGDFDIRVRVMDLTATDAKAQDSPKGSLMVRSGLEADAFDFMIDALPRSPSAVDGRIESIGRLDKNIGTDDLPGRGLHLWRRHDRPRLLHVSGCVARIQRQGDRLMSYFATANQTDFPFGHESEEHERVAVAGGDPDGSNFRKTVLVGLATVAHDNGTPGRWHRNLCGLWELFARARPAFLPPTALQWLRPCSRAFSRTEAGRCNWTVSLPANGLGYPPDIVQSGQGAAQQIVWNSGGFGSVARDVIDSISGETADGFSDGALPGGLVRLPDQPA